MNLKQGDEPDQDEPPAENVPVPPVLQRAEASGRGRNYQAGRDLHINTPSRRQLFRLGTAVGVLAGTAAGTAGAFLASDMLSREQKPSPDRTAKRNSAPLRVATEYLWQPDDNLGWVFSDPLSPDQEARLLAASGYDEAKWPIPEAGVKIARSSISPHTFSRMRLTMENPSDSPVLVTGIRARARHFPPMAGAIVWRGTQGESAIPQIGFDLDEKESIARVRHDDGKLGDPYSRHKTIFLESREVMQIDVMAQTARHLCEWHIEFMVLVGGVGGKKAVVTLDEAGRPFRTSSLADRYEARYLFDVAGAKWRASGAGPI